MIYKQFKGALVILKAVILPRNAPMTIRDMKTTREQVHSSLVERRGLFQMAVYQVIIADAKQGLFQPHRLGKLLLQSFNALLEDRIIVKLAVAFSRIKPGLCVHCRVG